jgi:hypothetical protein
MTTEQEIEYLIKLHYSNNIADIERWYSTKHNILGASPKELIRQGRALELLEYIKEVKR